MSSKRAPLSVAAPPSSSALCAAPNVIAPPAALECEACEIFPPFFSAEIDKEEDRKYKTVLIFGPKLKFLKK